MPGKLHTPLAEAPVWVRSSEIPSGRGPRPGGRGRVVGVEQRKGAPSTSWAGQICVGW